MKNPVSICIIFVVVTFFACNKHVSQGKHMNSKTVLARSVKERLGKVKAQADSLSNEEFSQFIQKFHTSILFREERIPDVVRGYNSDDVDLSDESNSSQTYTWKRKDLSEYLTAASAAKKDSSFKVSYEETRQDEVVECIYIPDSSCFFLLYFNRQNGKWYLCDFTYHFL